MSTTAEQVNLGMQHHAAGRMAEAEAIYRHVLERDPACAGALHLLGVARAQQNDHEAAIPLILQAVKLAPHEAMFHSNLALAYVQTSQGELALPAAQRALQLDPNHPDSINHLGSALRLLGRHKEAIAAFQSALRLRANFPDALHNLSLAYQEAGMQDEAAQILARSLAANGNDGRANLLLGGVLHAQRKFPEAIAALQKAAAAGHEPAQAYCQLGAAYQDMGDFAQAESASRKAIALDPNHFAAHNNLGYALSSMGRIEEAIESLKRAIELRPDHPESWNNLANAYLDLLQIDDAMRCYNTAIFFRPDDIGAQWNRSLLWLLLGDFENGWHEYEWRWLRFPLEKRRFTPPRWSGEKIAGKTILLHGEQGLGDVIQFVRYASIVAELGATVILECQPSLAGLMRNVRGVSQLIPRGEQLPAFDFHCPLIGVPYAVGTSSVAAIPAEPSYLSADPQLTREWAAKLGAAKPGGQAGKGVGLVWAGAHTHGKDRARSIRLEKLKPLLNAKGVQFVSLQKVVPLADQAALKALQLRDPTPEFRDFSDTAAVIANLDLVITVDTSVAHLAGAMGKSVWILLPFEPDWRWLLEREDSPWYPSARLFRQQTRDDWESVLTRVRKSLDDWSIHVG